MLARAGERIDAVLQGSFAAALAAPRDIDDYLALFDPAWSVHGVRARVAGTRVERGGAVSVWLTPNRAWQGFRAGQYVQLGIEHQGVRHVRCFSISSAPSDGWPLRVSMRALPGGKASSWARTAKRGEVVQLAQAAGDFVLPDSVPDRLLFASAGSGVTPIVSMLRELKCSSHRGRAHWLHFGRRETMLEDEVVALASELPWLKLAMIRTDGPDAAPPALRRFGPEVLSRHVPDWNTHETFVCGPQGMLQAAHMLFASSGCAHRLHTESFGGPSWDHTPPAALAGDWLLTFATSRLEIIGNARRSLLEQAESAGLRPQHGCRMGICRTCTRRKRSGTVQDVRTGELSDRPDEDIQLCVSVPRSDVIIDL